MLLVALHSSLEARLAVLGGIAAIGIASYLVLLAALPISRFIGVRGRVVFDKVMGLLVGAIGIQFIIDGVRPLAKEMLSGLK
jgi:multiple antibiotic resistance protein